MTPTGPPTRPATDAAATPAPASPEPRRLRAAPVVSLAVTLVLAGLVVSISYGFAREYGDTSAGDAAVAGRALRDWAVGVVLVLADPVLLSRIGGDRAGRPGEGVRPETAGAGGERLSWR